MKKSCLYLLSNSHSPQICKNGKLLVRMCQMRVSFSRNDLWRMWASLASPSRHFGEFGEFLSQVSLCTKKIFLGIKRSSLPLPNLPNLPNLLNSLNTRQIRRHESQKFGGLLVFANSSTRQKRRMLGEYSNSLNLPASGHCLIFTQEM